jgi:hypothetical protein
MTQLDLAARKSFRTGRLEWEAQFDFFNVLNADTITNYGSNNFGTAAYSVPSSVLLGRLPRVGVQLKW